MIIIQWKPDRSVSEGARAYHNAVVSASWHRDNINQLIYYVRNYLRNNDIVVDFGAGTGSSTVYFIKSFKKANTFILVDNSPSWLGHAYEILHNNPEVNFYLLPKQGRSYKRLDQVLGKEAVNHVLCANTVHLIPDILPVFKGIYTCLKPKGTFSFQSGNIKTKFSKGGLLMIDDTVNMVHDFALNVIKKDKKYQKYWKDLDKKVEEYYFQRRFIFPNPRTIDMYKSALEKSQFASIKISYKKIVVNYSDWIKFLCVKRLQAGILPEIGGINPKESEIIDRDAIIKKSSSVVFENLSINNPYANSKSFTALWTYIISKKR